LCRLPATSFGDTQRELQSTCPKTSGPSKISWKRHIKYSEGGRSQSFDKSNRPSGGAFGSGGHVHGNFSLEQKRKLPPREQKKKDSWIKPKQELSSAEFQQIIKTSSCINYGEQCHIFDACTKPKPS